MYRRFFLNLAFFVHEKFKTSATSFYVSPKAIEYGISGEGSLNPDSDLSEVKK